MTRLPILLDIHQAVRLGAVAVTAVVIGWALSTRPPTQRPPDAALTQVDALPIAGPAGPAGPIPEPLFAQAVSPPVGEVAGDLSGPPDLLGLAGRLPDDVEVLIRDEQGQTSTLRVGQSALGWKLVSVAADRAVFEKNGEQVIRTLD